MERIAVVGMGPIGISIGLALKQARLSNTEIVGTAPDRQLLSTALKMGAMDRSVGTFKEAVEGAQMVILDLPIGEVHEFMEAVGDRLEDGCVVTDTSTIKVRVMRWAEEFLPKGVSYVGGRPLIKKTIHGHQDADASLFQGALYCVMPSRSADNDSVKSVVGLVELLGAKPLFLDPHEHDSYAVAMSHLPTVLSAAYVNATAGNDAWREMHKLATSDFAEMSRLASSDPMDNETASLADPESMVYWIDEVIRALYTIRNQIKESKEELLDTFIKAWEARARWEVGAVVSSSEPTLPSARESMATAFFGERAVKRYQQMTGDKKKESWKYERKPGRF